MVRNKLPRDSAKYTAAKRGAAGKLLSVKKKPSGVTRPGELRQRQVSGAPKRVAAKIAGTTAGTAPSAANVAVLGQGKFLRLLKSGRWEFAARIGGIGAVAIVAVNAKGELILIEQYRVPVGAPVIELPAGLVGDELGQEGEAGQSAAERELLEETGYHAAQMRLLCHGAPSAGLSSEQVTLFQALSPTKVTDGGGTGHEEIVVHEVPLASVRDWLEKKSREGFVIDVKIYAALYFLE